ncbi:iron ABC transporter permease [Devosia sp. XJ19-1]|uniref:Iron ABC transporter permease n=1 Tax=Devosia ureilytica TaxID=2952754 RepID=A0A9Q4AN57_9HYPH|nr:iron ABC transporter permease [Devosia ureilytica]MCP8883661.1 iron ABC transporter permease [Devosia ureilytica]MCP8887269.1 iron ABC transporter permease [Devosia ureilytica]
MADHTAGRLPARPNIRISLWAVVAGVTAAFALLPIAAIAFIALADTGSLWGHVLAHVLPQAAWNTFVLLVGSGIIAMLVGTGAAWIVSAYDFRGRGVLEWALLLPLAVPAYIMAYAYLDILSPLGPVQGVVRWVLGYSSPREFRLPDIRSMWGAILVFGFVLYPYVYLTARAMFLAQTANVVEAARTLGVPRSGIFWRVALPMARPAIAVGVSLALMEVLNDVGASQFLGVRTMTAAVYTTWIVRTDLAGASQIAMGMLAMVLALVMLERWARRDQRFAANAQSSRSMPRQPLKGLPALIALALGAAPILIGFAGPALYLIVAAVKRLEFAGLSASLVRATVNTVSMSAMATLVILVLGFAVAYAARLHAGGWSATAMRVASLGYAVPGTVLAIGILVPVAAFDRTLSSQWQSLTGLPGGLLLLGSGAALVYAYAARFLAISAGGIDAGLSRIPPAFDHASRTLGQSSTGTLLRVHLPLSRPALTAAGLLVFVDCMKELPATLLLRPLNFESLATLLYGEAARGTYEDAALAALIIVAIGILPVILLAHTSRSVR